jgi:signal transduction histidine kinase
VNVFSIVLIALAWAAGGGLIAWLVTIPLQRRSLTGLLASVVLTGTVASVAAVIGNVHAMFISTNELVAVVSVSVVAGIVASVSALVVSRRLARDNNALRAAITAIGQGQVPECDRRLSTELDQLHAELAATAARLAESRERERALERSRRELIAWISHDLRTPLAGLRAMAEALEDGMAEQPDLYYKQIRAQVDQLSGMVDDLFDLSRIQAGAFAIDTEPVRLDDLLSECIAGLTPLARAVGVGLESKAEGTATVNGSPTELGRAVTNLVANAIQHTPTNGIVRVSMHTDDGRTCITVRDQCGGIPPDAVCRVFEVGYRQEAARTPRLDRRGGAGLGLAIVRGIITAHAGTVDVRNVAGGCEFTIRLWP